MRQTERFKIEGSNSLWQLYQTVSFFKVMKNFVVIQLARYTPFLPVKNWLYRTLLRMDVGKQTSFALMVMVDLMFPERITVGHNSIIGYNTTILTHEYLINEYRLGYVTIGDEVMIGANCTILPGVRIGDGATVAAGTVVSKDIPAYAFAKGNPVMITETK
ncbi:Acetyltransferase (isoleucine patch superfamily) [Halolactibacillus halophilus]|uniref:Acetyltransferase n=1 Tax=Halolactibacillus halophilus TaxID=306540 RepID=A0A1I5PJI3_9BACI|nr:acyltransferase [Halolactibacillus halophilus]GEM02044.1 acetyltransferase [Halolactibacillus halophilus]SFP34189.1 Acetyltransferase (isoleucine patch superfamily) [Halolactibacillus halophilus]